MTRNVALSKSSTSSASRMLVKLLRLDSNWWMLGISKWTMFDHAYREREREREKERTLPLLVS